jgi:hypothetical protein
VLRAVIRIRDITRDLLAKADAERRTPLQFADRMVEGRLALARAAS